METGSYVLLLHLLADTTLELPGLGTASMPAGFYAYTDEAQAPESLTEKIKYHLSPDLPPYRHIDFLQSAAELEEIWLASGTESRAHAWADLLLSIPGGVNLVDGFGVSGCDCDTHLVYFDVRPTIEDFKVEARQRFPNDVIAKANVKDMR